MMRPAPTAQPSVGLAIAASMRAWACVPEVTLFQTAPASSLRRICVPTVRPTSPATSMLPSASHS